MAKMSRTLGTSRTCASSTHEKMSGDSRISKRLGGLLFSSQFGGCVPQDSGCNFLHEHTKATATCSIYINRLLVVNCTEATATFISYRLRVRMDPSALFKSSINRLPPRPRMVACDSSRIFPNKSIHSNGLYPVCWKGSHEELPRLHPESLNSG
jgi:hypothetical protein